MFNPRYLPAALLIVIGLAGGLFFIGAGIDVQPAEPRKATRLPEPRPLAEFELLADDGSRLTRDGLRGQWTLLFFGFTHCPDICPATLQQLAVARRRLSENGADPLPDILLISVDPGRDTPALLAEYTARFGEGVSGATGEPAALAAFSRDLGVHYEVAGATTDGSDYEVSHSTAVLLANPAAELAAVFSAPHDIAAFVNDLPLLMSAP